MARFSPSGILVEAENFSEYGGWILDSQFEHEMGSSYLLAHGNGKPAVDATTIVSVPETGRYNVWVRAKDWVPGHHPGRFALVVNGQILSQEFGANDLDWSWQCGGTVDLEEGQIQLSLRDLTGFCGRCDAIFFSLKDVVPPEPVDDPARIWRKRLRGLPVNPVDAGDFDVVVVGGGVVGSAAALTAARLGDRVALIQDRPVLGGNASVEIGLSPRGIRGLLIEELTDRHANGDLRARDLLDAEPTATVFIEYTVYSTVTASSSITSVDCRHARTGREIRISAPVFIDCTGKSLLGLLSGAHTLSGQESRSEHSESLAPVRGDGMHHGHTLFFRTRLADTPIDFPDVPWAVEVAKDYADLGGQLIRPGVENGEGPLVKNASDVPDRAVPRRMTRPLTHFWEYGQWLDPYTHGEHIRDHLLRAIYGTFSNVKNLDPKTYANLDFDHVAFVAAQGQFRRYQGDYVLTENDIRTHRQFPDAVVQNDGAFCLHYPGDKYDFRLKHWEWDERDGRPYDIPFRCLYSANISNLMFAGKHLSTTHIAGSNAKFMGNGGQHGIATAAAAHLCKNYNTTPRGVYREHMRELQSLSASVTGTDCGAAAVKVLSAKL
ncbi:hypothetical protein LTR17_008034 [Elasticomyces elasticus]|nr:hypothetical protein LTR17_008034 [Elasticomyces elasticus]